MAKIYDDLGKRVIAEICSKCLEEELAKGRDEYHIAATHSGNGEDRFSFGIYAGHYCDKHWATSGYKGSTPETADEQFDPDYAGERLEEEDY